MHRQSLPVVFALALMLTACGSVGGVSSSIITPCHGTVYDTVLWSPDGKHIAFTSGESYNYHMSLYVMNPDGSGVTTLARDLPYSRVQQNGFSYNRLNFQWLPDSSAVYYFDGHTIFVVGLDGKSSEISLLYYRISDALISPDGTKIAYNKLNPNGTDIDDIDLANRDGSGNVQLVQGSGRYDLEEWSPDGTRLAYIRYDSGYQYAYTIKIDGGDQRQLAEGAKALNWSPDGERLVFISSKDFGIHVVRADGTHEDAVTVESAKVIKWLPGGDQIAFVGSDNHLKVVDVGTNAIQTLSTILVANLTQPAWSPDGSQVAFIGDDPVRQYLELTDIYVVNRDGTGQTRLTDNPGRYQCFNWPF